MPAPSSLKPYNNTFLYTCHTLPQFAYTDLASEVDRAGLQWLYILQTEFSSLPKNRVHEFLATPWQWQNLKWHCFVGRLKHIFLIVLKVVLHIL